MTDTTTTRGRGGGQPVNDPAGLDPLLLSAKDAAALIGVGLRTFRAMDAAGRIPAPVRLSPGCVRWRLSELRAWVVAGSPPRVEWEDRKAASRR
ncbi:helix-turn-helix transcriptional regulator [Urbifossiella limnaea]|uniref:Helix-turn-helix domain-containing protein n=1 Tax=Urbifossiella limnaea TaxID=2528023 RepID=A0A517Y0V6_9BACT|nr:hypothetical protein [Urbifossiella limnaea]QDU23381.1 hypothetical protein ETAA1_53800 [Urbifossiella limnaea]